VRDGSDLPDMTTFESDREYALVIVPFRSFLHTVTTESQLAALERFREALAPDGELVFDTFAPDFEFICEGYGEPDEQVVEVEGRLALLAKRQIELLFRVAGYGEWAVYGGFDLDPLERSEQEMVWIARP